MKGVPLWAFVLLFGVGLGFKLSEPAQRIAEAVHSDVVLAFGSDSCRACIQNKPQLAQLKSKGVAVVYLDNATNLIPLPLYLLVRDGEIRLETHSIEELKASL